MTTKVYNRACVWKRTFLEQERQAPSLGEGRATMERAIDLLFELAHLLTDCSVSHVQLRRGLCEAGESASGLEGTQSIEWQQYPLHSQEFI
jgi:hypothetical protein